MKLADTPEGRLPITEKVTAAAEPLDKVAVIDDERLVDPCTTLRLLGEGVDRLKSKTAPLVLTVRLNVFVAVAPPVAVPVRVIMDVPVVAVREAVNVTSTLQGEGDGVQVGDGLKLEVTPAGRAERLKVTGWAVPLVTVEMRLIELLVVPCVTLTVFGDAATVKVNGPSTVRVIWALCVRLPATPVAVIV